MPNKYQLIHNNHNHRQHFYCCMFRQTSLPALTSFSALA